MFPALLVAFAASGALSPSPAAPPVTQRYRIELSIASRLDLSVVGGAPLNQEQSAIGFVTMTLTDSLRGQALRVVIDSATLHIGNQPAPAEVLAGVRGMVVHGFLDSSGQVRDLTLAGDNQVVGMLRSALGDFFPRTQGLLAAGASRVDTLQIAATPGNSSISTTVITTYTGQGKEQFHGVEADRIAATFTTSATGTMRAAGGDAQMSGTGSGIGNYYMNSTGLFLGGSRTTTQQSTITMQGAPAPIPLHATTVMAVTPLP